MGIGVVLNKQGKHVGHGQKPCTSNTNYGDMLLERVEEKANDAADSALLASEIVASQRVYEGFSLNALAVHFGINSNELDGFVPNEPASTGRHYAFLRNGLIEVWKATSPTTTDDPSTGGFIRVDTVTSDDDGGGTSEPTNPASGTITVKEVNLTNVAVPANSVATNTITATDVNTWFMAQVTLKSDSENLAYNVRIRDDIDNIIYESTYLNTELDDKDMFSINAGNVFKIEIENLNQSSALLAYFSMKYVVVT